MNPSYRAKPRQLAGLLLILCAGLLATSVLRHLAFPLLWQDELQTAYEMLIRQLPGLIGRGLAAAVYLSIFFVEDPTAPWVLGLLAFMGVAEISAFVSSQALVGERALAERRGAIIGLFGVSGAIGILIGTAGGGWLFARFGPSTPFVLFGCLNALVFLWSLRVRALRL